MAPSNKYAHDMLPQLFQCYLCTTTPMACNHRNPMAYSHNYPHAPIRNYHRGTLPHLPQWHLATITPMARTHNCANDY